MFSDVKLENRMVRRGLNLKIPHIRLGHGLDYASIPGVKNFPIYHETNGFTSHAKMDPDEYLMNDEEVFHGVKPKQKTHTSVPSGLDPYNSNYQKAGKWTTLQDANFMDKIYGMVRVASPAIRFDVSVPKFVVRVVSAVIRLVVSVPKFVIKVASALMRLVVQQAALMQTPRITMK